MSKTMLMGVSGVQYRWPESHSDSQNEPRSEAADDVAINSLINSQDVVDQPWFKLMLLAGGSETLSLGHEVETSAGMQEESH